MNYFISDFHFNHKNIIEWERTQFSTIEEHDSFTLYTIEQWAKKLHKDDEFWFLGDFGDISFLYQLPQFKCKTYMIYGNHDKKDDYEKFAGYFDEVHLYPLYLSNRLVVSHLPVAAYDDTINVHGHLHGTVIDKPNYINCSINDHSYTLLSGKEVANHYSKLPKYNRRFLWEPFAADYKMHGRNPEDVVVDKNGRIDLSASRVLQKMNQK